MLSTTGVNATDNASLRVIRIRRKMDGMPKVPVAAGEPVMQNAASDRGVTLVVLQAAWIALALLLAVVVWAPAGNIWRAVTILPWIAGMALLSSGTTGRTLAAGWSMAFAGTGTRLAGIALVTLLLLSGWAMSLLACGFFSVWTGLTLLTLLAAGRPRSASALMEGGSLMLVTVAGMLFVLEAVLRLPSIAGQLGLPSEQRHVEAQYDGVERANMFGLRTRYERIAKPAGVRRVVTIGDSFTWGSHIPSSDSTWPAQFERLLRAAPGSPKVEVINMGKRGYTTVNEVEALNRLGWQFDPDLVVVEWLANDVYPSGPGFQSIRNWPPVPYLLPENFRRGALRNSNVYGFFQQQYTNWKLGDAQFEYPALYVDSNPNWIANKKAFRELGDSARARGVPVVIMMWPLIGTKAWTPEEHPHRLVHQKVAAVIRDAGLGLLDLVPVFAAAGGDGRRWWVKPYDHHPSPGANRLVAQTLKEFLDRQPPRPP